MMGTALFIRHSQQQQKKYDQAAVQGTGIMQYLQGQTV
jgi:hypothetical protein